MDRAARRQQLSRQRLGGRFRGLAAPPPLPPVETPGPPAKFFRITPSLLEALLNVPKPPILNQKFRISEPSSEVDTVYQIRSVEISSDGLRFGMQTEGSSIEYVSTQWLGNQLSLPIEYVSTVDKSVLQ